MPRLRNLILINNNIKTINGYPFEHLNRLEYLDLSHNSLSSVENLFQFETEENRMKKLSLAFNLIEEIPGDTFVDLTSLVELDLSHNYISDLSEEPFSNLTSLEVLRLNNNLIKVLNGAVNNLISLKHLFLKGNQIQNIDESSLQIIYHLETFDISGNLLEKLKPIVFRRHWHHFGGVCKIILSENQITSVPNGTSKDLMQRYTRDLKNKVDVLTELDLSKNAISNIEYDAFQSVIQMVSLDLSCNKLIDFVVNADDLTSIKYLNLSTNYIMNLYFESFSSMANLQNLDLSHNKLDYLPDETFTNNYNLKYVNMTFNEIKELENLRIKMFHPEGGVLDLSNNGLSRLSIPFGEGLRLTMLILHSNKITDAASVNLIYQNELKTLDMNSNWIEKLNDSSLRLPLSLTSLDLSSNNIKEIGPSTFHRVTHLKSLYLRNNKLKSIEYGAFQGLTALSNLDLSYNEIGHLDSKVLMDLKSLSVLSLRHNGLNVLDEKGWIGHKYDLRVYLDGNHLTCDWLGSALRNFNNGYSKLRPASHFHTTSKHSLEGIPCVQKDKEIGELVKLDPAYVMADERLLITNQRILQAVKEETYYLRLFMNQLMADRRHDIKNRKGLNEY